jgi:apolipoprotein N-acyltransferase
MAPVEGHRRLARSIVARHKLASLAAGVLAATGFQPLALWPLALLAMGGFALLVARSTGWRQAAWLGWLFGLGHFTLGNNWIATAFTYQANMPAVLGWAAVPLLSLYLALFPALAAGAARALTGAIGDERPRWLIAPVLAATWIVSEWMRGWVLTGYAWNPFGIVLLGPFDRPGLAAIAPWTGTYALSGLAVLVSAALVLALAERRFLHAAAGALLLAAGMYWPVGPGLAGRLPVTIVQPHLTQERLNAPLLYEANFQRLARLSRPSGEAETRLVLWPESGLVDYLREGYPQRYYDQTTAIGGESVLLTGAVDLEIEGGRAVGAHNSVTAVDGGSGDILAGYSKAHLVPFGEFLPFRSLLEPIGLSRLVPGTLDFLPGPGPRTLDLGPHGRAAIQICYEIVFSGEVVDRTARPDYIFNPSNDGWFGAFGPPQHLAQARLRALEEGLPVLRATTTGISAVIDARGIVREHLGRGVMGRIDTTVPPALPPTLFARLGNKLALFWALLLLCSTAIAIKRRGR